MSDIPTDDIPVGWFHTVWSGVLTIAGGIILWNWNRLVKEIDEKVDKTEVAQLRADLAERWRLQDQMHGENRQRLDRILMGISKLKNGD